MNELISFVESYYNNNMVFNQVEFLSVIEALFKQIEGIKNADLLNTLLTKMMNSFQSKDYYLVVQIIEYEIIPYFSEK